MPAQLTSLNGQLNIAALMQKLQSEQDNANKANDSRYNQALQTQTAQHGVQQGLYSGAQQDIAGVGGVANARIDLNQQKSQAAAQQGLISRGLGNTSITNSVMRGYADDAELQHQGVDEQQAQLRSGLKTQQAGMEGTYGDNIAGIMERRNDVAPDTGLYAGLIQSAMAGQTGSAKPTTTQYIGSDGRSYNNPGSAMASGGAGGAGGGGVYNQPSSGGGGGGGSGGGGGASFYAGADWHGSDPGAVQSGGISSLPGGPTPQSPATPTISGAVGETDPNAGKGVRTGNSPGIDALTGEWSSFPRYYV